MKPEELLVKRVTSYMLTEYPTTPFNINFAADLRITIGVAAKMKKILGRWSKGQPDMIVYRATKKYGALLIELKATKTVHSSEHTKTQAAFHALMRLQGYKVEFACGYDEAVKLIDEYMTLKRKKQVK